MHYIIILQQAKSSIRFRQPVVKSDTYTRMASNLRRTDDLQRLRTRELVLQNSNGTYPPLNTVLICANDGVVEASTVTINNGELFAPGGINVDNNFSIDSSGNVIIGGTINITSTIDLSGGINVNNQFIVDTSGHMVVSGLSDLSGGINVNNLFTVDPTGSTIVNNGLSVLTGNLDATGLSSLNGGINVNNQFTVDPTGSTIVNNGLSVLTGNLDAAGLSSLNGGINVNNQFTVDPTGSMIVNNGVAVNNGLSVLTGNLAVNSPGTLSAAGGATLGSTTLAAFNSTGNSFMSGTANLSIGTGGLTVSGTTTIGTASSQVTFNVNGAPYPTTYIPYTVYGSNPSILTSSGNGPTNLPSIILTINLGNIRNLPRALMTVTLTTSNLDGSNNYSLYLKFSSDFSGTEWILTPFCGITALNSATLTGTFPIFSGTHYDSSFYTFTVTADKNGAYLASGINVWSATYSVSPMI